MTDYRLRYTIYSQLKHLLSLFNILFQRIHFYFITNIICFENQIIMQLRKSVPNIMKN